MVVRGAPLIGATAAYGLALALAARADDARSERAYRALLASRPTAVNLRYALDDVRARVAPLPPAERAEAAWARAAAICEEDVALNRRIGEAGLRADRSDPSPSRAHGQHPDPLQRRLAGDRRLGHGDGADLSGARSRRAGACLCRRDAAAQSGRGADRLRTRPARRAAYADRRQRRRPSHAARQDRSLHRRRRPDHRARRRRQQDRHLSEGAGGARQRRAVLRRRAVHDHRLDDRRRPGRDRDRGAGPRAKSRISSVGSTTAASPASARRRRAPRRQSGFRRHAGRIDRRLHHRPRRCARPKAGALAARFGRAPISAWRSCERLGARRSAAGSACDLALQVG